LKLLRVSERENVLHGGRKPLSVVTKRGSDCPQNCPYDTPKQRLQSQRQPTRSIGEVENREGFTKKIEDGREADFRLANRRFRPLSHLTVAKLLMILTVRRA